LSLVIPYKTTSDTGNEWSEKWITKPSAGV
jgi:hypothetical protein